jgi:S-formylglutathione hydrolase FrmB
MAASAAALAPTAAPLRFRLSFDPAVQTSVYTGRVYVVLTEPGTDEPRKRMTDWFSPPRIFARDVEGVRPGASVDLDGASLSYPDPLRDLPSAEYRIQAVARRSPDHPFPGEGPGDLYSKPVTRSLDALQSGVVELVLKHVVPEKSFEQTERVKLVELESPLLSSFHGRTVKLRAGVVLPEGWEAKPEAKYPVLYVIPGFGGSHRMAHALGRMRAHAESNPGVLMIVPDPTCYWGHSVFADSETNGPWGKALVEELIPHVERTFHGAQSRQHRYLTGVSSGGWSCLWLQITYPDVFNGCWAHCPDPVDFRDFQRIDLYAEGSNMFIDGRGERRPLARRGDHATLYYDDFVQREEVLGPGGQIRSFEAVFSHRGPDGRPAPLFDAATGRVHTATAKTWERFDIRLVLERNWATLGPKLAGKLHVFAGAKDTFFLEGAVALLKDSLSKLGSDAEVVIVPDMAHGLYREAVEPMFETIERKWRPNFGSDP